MGYHVRKGTQAKVARPGETARDHAVQANQRFDDDELVASPGKVPDEDSAAARWARAGWYVFRRADWYLLVRDYDVDIEY